MDAQSEWRRLGRPTLTAYPYAAHCTQVALLHFGGIRVKGKPREDHDRSDLEHLKHLPFASVFASDDKLVREIARHLIRPDQQFVTRQQLVESLEATA